MTPPTNCTRCGFPLVRTATDPKERHQCPTCHHGIPLTDVEKRLTEETKAYQPPPEPSKNAEKRARRKAKGKKR